MGIINLFEDIKSGKIDFEDFTILLNSFFFNGVCSGCEDFAIPKWGFKEGIPDAIGNYLIWIVDEKKRKK